MVDVIDRIGQFIDKKITAEELINTYESSVAMDLGFKLSVQSYVTTRGIATHKIELEPKDLSENDIKRLIKMGFAPNKMVKVTQTDRS